MLVVVAAMLAAVGVAHAQTATIPAADQPIARTQPVVRPAPAGMISSTDATAFIAALQRAGQTGEIKTENGASYVLGHAGTTPFQAFLSGCNTAGAQCTQIELYAGFTGTPHIPLTRINGWNARTRFARAFLDEQGDPALQMDLSLEGGLSAANLKDVLETWGAALETYSLFLVARVPPVGAVSPGRPGG
jgi:hypothetical protein